MTRFVGARGIAAASALWFSLIGGSTQALGQVQVSPLIAQSFDLRAVPAPQLQAMTSEAMATAALPPALGQLGAQSLAALVDANSVGDLDQEANCLATAVYFESKGEPLEGQLAVAQVVINRAASGRYPTSLCGVVKQRAQFSFVRNGVFPRHDANSLSWHKARAIARIAQGRLAPSVPANVLWYHANYVAPRWRQTLTLVDRIGAHIFYRA